MRTNRLTLTLCVMAVVGALLCQSSQTQAEKKAKKKGGVKAKVLARGLDNPTGVAVHPKSGDVYIATHSGVMKYTAGAKKKKGSATLAIGGYPDPTDIYGKGPKYPIGPLGVTFTSDGLLVVGDGSRKDGAELVRIYKVDGEKAIKESDAVHTLGPIKPSDQSAKGEGNFYGVAIGAGAIYITCNGDDTKGWIAKAEVKDGKPGTLVPTIATKEQTQVDAPVPLTFSPDGSELVVGQMGEVNVAGDSLLTTYDPKTGTLKKKWKTGLSDIAGLAYSPKTKKLYAVDFSWVDAKQGGLFRLDIEGDAVKATKLVSLDKPTALAFDKEGKLYITVFGTEDPNGDRSPGKLLSIEPGL